MAYYDIFLHLAYNDRWIFTKLGEIIVAGKRTNPLHLGVVFRSYSAQVCVPPVGHSLIHM